MGRGARGRRRARAPLLDYPLRAECGGDDVSLYQRLRDEPPVREVGLGPGGHLPEPADGALPDAHLDGMLDGWNLTVRYEDNGARSEFRVRVDLHPRSPSWSLYGRQLGVVQRLVAFARARVRTRAGHWAVDALDELEVPSLPAIHVLAARPDVVRVRSWEGDGALIAAALLDALPLARPAVLEVLPWAVWRGVPLELLRALAARPLTRLALPDARVRQQVLAAAPALQARLVDEPELTPAEHVRG